MHKVIIEEPYEFIPPYRGTFWSSVFRSFYLKRFLKTTYGIVSWQLNGLEHLRDSLQRRRGIVLCPNHSRPSDPMLMGLIVKETPCHVFAMASWHVFKQSRLESFIANRVGGFSVYREGLDRLALETSIDIVSRAERPLVVFPEGVISRANDRLMPLMDGVSFIARMAAKRRDRLGEKAGVVIHPIAIRYRLLGPPEQTIAEVLTRLEERTFWKTHEYQPVLHRIRQLGQALLAAREIECMGCPQPGSLTERMQRMIDLVLHPQECEWIGGPRSGDVIARVKDLRSAMLPELLKGNISAEERRRRWRQLTDSYYLQCLSLYPPGYLEDGVCGLVTPERVVETVHRLEEDMTDHVTLRPEWHVTLDVGPAMEVNPDRRKGRSGDPLTDHVRRRMLGLLQVPDWWPPLPVTPAAESHSAVVPLAEPANNHHSTALSQVAPTPH